MILFGFSWEFLHDMCTLGSHDHAVSIIISRYLHIALKYKCVSTAVWCELLCVVMTKRFITVTSFLEIRRGVTLDCRKSGQVYKCSLPGGVYRHMLTDFPIKKAMTPLVTCQKSMTQLTTREKNV